MLEGITTEVETVKTSQSKEANPNPSKNVYIIYSDKIGHLRNTFFFRPINYTTFILFDLNFFSRVC